MTIDHNDIKVEFIEHDYDRFKKTIIFDNPHKNTSSEPDYLIAVYARGISELLIKLYIGEEVKCFKEVIYCNGFIVIGCGEKVYFYDLKNNIHRCHKIEGYFGHLYSNHNIKGSDNKSIYAASELCLYKFTMDGQLIWKSETLGIDGVIVEKIEDNIISGLGEWDPPDGWEKFRLQNDTGKPILK